MRVERMTALADASAYPGKTHVDMTMFVQPYAGQAVRAWLLTGAQEAVVGIDDVEMRPSGRQRCGGGRGRWLDLGVTDQIGGRFGQLRVEGMSAAEARESVLLMTGELQFEPEGSVAEVEEALFGISRERAGRTTLSPSRVEVGERATLTVEYAAGPGGLPAGARVRFAVPRAFSRPQNHDPEAAGYTEATAAGGDGGPRAVEIESLELSEEAHEEFDIICTLPEGLEANGRLQVRYATEQMYIFPWRRDAVERPWWYAHLAPMAAAVAVDDRRRWVPLTRARSHSFETVAGRAERLHLLLPGRVHEDEEIWLQGVFTDRFRNVPQVEGIPANVRLRIVDKAGERDLGRPRGAFVAPHRFRMSLGRIEEGIYRVRAYDPATGELMAQSNPLEVLDDDDERLNLYWGEIHGHTEMSDGCGDFAEMYRHARDEGRQDFAAAADHACYFSDNQWEWMQDVTNSFNERGRFVALLGYEWAGRQGHRCIYARGRRLDLFRGMYEPESTLDVVYEHFHDDDYVVAGPHHTGANGRMEHHDPRVERFIEIYSMWGASDRLGAPKAPLFPGAHPLPAHEWLNRGAKLGFTGGGDCHEGKSGWTPDDPEGQGTSLHAFAHQLRYRCGLTAALMPELRRRELIRALRDRRTYATTGARMLLEFEVAGVPMGQTGEGEQAHVRAEVHGQEELARLEVMREGEVVWTEDVEGLDVELAWSDPEPVGESTWFYLHVMAGDGEEAWSSPVWLEND